MKFKIAFFLIVASIGFSFKMIAKPTKIKNVEIKWMKQLKGNFSFKEEWSYSEFVYKNKFGQLSCDGDCPIEIDAMKNKYGKIYNDSLSNFYQYIDTSHLFHSLESTNNMYEYSGTNIIVFKKQENGILRGESLENTSTHSRLILEINKDVCTAWVKFNSIKSFSEVVFPLEKGNIKIDQKIFEKGILKAVFDFKFENTLDTEKSLFWKGKIYSTIEII